MQCPQCRRANENHYMFCLGCGAALPQVPAGEPGGAPAPQAAAGPRCAQCGGHRTAQASVGPQLGVRVFTAGRYDDVPLAHARVCVDCGHVALQLPEDARAYLAGLAGR